MTTNKITAQNIVDAAVASGIDAKLWTKSTANGNFLRVYTKTDRKSVSVFLDLKGSEDDVTDASLVVKHVDGDAALEAQYRLQFADFPKAFTAAKAA